MRVEGTRWDGVLLMAPQPHTDERGWFSRTGDAPTLRRAGIDPTEHGFQALTDVADVCYRIDAEHDPSENVSVRWDDPDLGVWWPLPVSAQSAGDRAAPPWSALVDRLVIDRA